MVDNLGDIVTLAAGAVAGYLGYRAVTGGASGAQSGVTVIERRVGGAMDGSAGAGGAAGTDQAAGGSASAGGAGGSSSGGSSVGGLPSGGDDAYSEAVRDYYDEDSTPDVPFGNVGESKSRADKVSSGTLVGL